MPWKLSSRDLHQLTVRALCRFDHASPCAFPACTCGARSLYEQQSNAVLAELLPAITRQLFEVTKPKADK